MKKNYLRINLHNLFCFAISTLLSLGAYAQVKEAGFTDHGVASPISNHRGTVATVDGNGRNVVLIWLFDHTGGYALLMVDAETGKSEQFKMPFSPDGDTPYSSILSTDNKFYTLFNGNFAEFDPVKRAFTFSHAVKPKMAMGMAEDKNGVIWAVTYPNSGVVSFNPKTREIKDYGYVYKQNWLQYPRYVATDNTGWVYFGLGNTASQIIAFNPVSGEAKPMFNEAERKRGIAYVYRDKNGKVYGQSLQDANEDWHEFYKGSRRKISKHHSNPVPMITGSQALFHTEFPDGKRIKICDLTAHKLVVEDPAAHTSKEVSFKYTSQGAIVMGVGTSPDGKVVGGTAFPMRFFSYDPKKDAWENHAAPGQFNALTRQGDSLFFGVYPSGYLLNWNAGKPKKFIECTPAIHRPHRLIAYPDGKTLIMGGTPEYGYTGGGLLFWDREKGSSVLLKDSDIVTDQSTISLAPLTDGKLLGGTTTAPGTGGEKKANEAELYIIDMATKKLEWKKVVFPGVQSYTDMCINPEGLVYGITDRKTFFVFDAEKREVIHQQPLQAEFGLTTAEQCPRVFVHGLNKEIYILFRKGIAQVDPHTFKINWLATSPVPIDGGGDYLDGRIYFVGGSHIFSYQLNNNQLFAAGFLSEPVFLGLED
jgi:streptogramin lyase